MKTRNINLEKTPLLTNNIFKCVNIEAPTLPELKKKIKEYQILLARALTNSYQLTNLSLQYNGNYYILPDGTYRSSIYLNFSGKKMEQITNPEKTLQYIKRLTAMESKKTDIKIPLKIKKQETKKHHKSIIVPIQIKPEEQENEVVSRKQRQIIEQIITDTNLIKITFFKFDKQQNTNTNLITVSLKVDYEYIEVLEIPVKKSTPDELESR